MEYTLWVLWEKKVLIILGPTQSITAIPLTLSPPPYLGILKQMKEGIISA